MPTPRTLKILAALVCTIPIAALPGQDLQHLGNFHNISSNDGGEHCAGYSLGLWKYRDEILGLVDVHAGLCGDPPCAVIQDAKLDARSGRLRFRSTVNGRQI